MNEPTDSINGSHRYGSHCYTLSAKQQSYIRQLKQLIVDTDANIRGAILLMAAEAGLGGPLSLSEDCSELIATPAETTQPVPPQTPVP